jgi:hypothetical protein
LVSDAESGMKIISLALLVLLAFLAVWFLIVVPAERRHHERKLAMVKKRIVNRQSNGEAAGDSANDQSAKTDN